MKISYLFILFLFQSVLAQKPADVTRAKIEKSLTIAQSYFDFPKDTLVSRATFVIQNTKSVSEKGLAYHYLGNTYKVNGNLEQALESYEKENLIFKQLVEKDKDNIENKNNYANSIASLAIVFSQQSNYTKALEYHFKAKEIFTTTNNLEKLAAINNNIGIEYQSLNKLDLANNYFITATKINDKSKISNRLLYLNIGKNYLKKNDLLAAKSYFDKALIGIEKEENPTTVGELYNNLGYYYYLKNDFAKAKIYLDKAEVSLAGDTFGLSDTYYYLGLYQLSQKNEEEALAEFEKAIKICTELKLTDLQVEIEKNLSSIYQKKGNYEQAFLHHQKYSVLQEKLLADNNDKALAYSEMIASFEKNKLELQSFKEKQQFNFYIYLFSTLLLLLIIGFLFYQNRQKLVRQNLILEKDKSEFHQKALHLQMNPHFIFNCLGSISSFILQNENDTAIVYLNHFARLMRLTLENSKEKTISIDKEMESLKQYFELEKLRYESIFEYKITKTSNIEEDIHLPPMLLQPLVENAIIHGIMPKKATGIIEVIFDIQNEKLVCTIKDDGVGYYHSKKLKEGSVLSHKSIALEVLKDRIETLGGKFEIEEMKQENTILGTKITVTLNLN